MNQFYYWRKMGMGSLGPWYRLGFKLCNAVLFAIIIETMITWNTGAHSLAYIVAKYHYGLHDREPGNLAADAKENLQWVLFGVVLVLQILINGVFWLAVVLKGNRHIALLWTTIICVKTTYIAFLHTFTQEEWERTYTAGEALHKISAFLWGTVIFGFTVLTGFQTSYYLSTPEGQDKIYPIGAGLHALRDYYKAHLRQLAVILLVAEAVVNVHRCFHYPTTAYLAEAIFLNYEGPSELGVELSLATLALNCLALIVLRFKSRFLQKTWIFLDVILILTHFLLFLYVVIDWNSTDHLHNQMFNSYVALALIHLLSKLIIFLVLIKSFPRHSEGEEEEEEREGHQGQNVQELRV